MKSVQNELSKSIPKRSKSRVSEIMLKLKAPQRCASDLATKQLKRSNDYASESKLDTPAKLYNVVLPQSIPNVDKSKIISGLDPKGISGSDFVSIQNDMLNSSEDAYQSRNHEFTLGKHFK